MIFGSKFCNFIFSPQTENLTSGKDAKAQSLDLLFLIFYFACLAALREHIVIAIADD
jgi:uncharacterized protein with PQ loop repeat